MAKKEYESYEDIHARLVEAMQEACASDESGDYPPLEKDLSFLYEDKKPERRKQLNVSRFGKVAAILIIVLLSMNVVLLATDSNESYGDGGLLHRIYEGARGIFTDEDQGKYFDSKDMGSEYSIYSLNDLDKAKEFWNDLCYPEYIPEDYIFDSLYIEKEVGGSIKAEYIFLHDDSKLIIDVTSITDDSKFISNNSGEIIELDDRLIYLYWSDVYEMSIIEVIYDNCFVCIQAKLDDNSLIKIASNIN